VSVKLQYDSSSDAPYLRFSDEPVVESEKVSPGLVVDFDAAGKMVALEVLKAASRLPMDALIAAK
jgi:uncharacterized protein YuzE